MNHEFGKRELTDIHLSEYYSHRRNELSDIERLSIIRFTIHDLKHKPWKPQKHNFHSQQMTNVSIKKNGASNVSTLAMWADEVTASDLRLATILSKVKEYQLNQDNKSN